MIVDSSSSSSSTSSRQTVTQPIEVEDIEDDDPRDISKMMRAISSGTRNKLEFMPGTFKTAADAKPLFTLLSSSSSVTHVLWTASSFNDRVSSLMIACIVANRSMTHVTLTQNAINSATALALGDALRFNTSITQLDLNENNIGDIGFMALCDGVLAHPALSILSLTANQITDVGARAATRLIRYQQTLNALFLEENPISPVVVAELLEVWLANYTTPLTLLIFGSTPPDYADRVKSKILHIRNRLDARKKKEAVSKPAAASQPRTLLELAHLDFAEISVAYLNKLNMLQLDNRRLSDLTELYLDHNCITTVPSALFKELGRLHVLDLSSNQLASLPTEIGEMKELKVLNIAHNNLCALPSSIGSLKSLTHLDISFNVIETIAPDEGIVTLTGLRVLLMQRNFFTRLPAQLFGNLASLQTFSITGSPCFHPAKQRILEAWAVRVTKLDLSESNLSVVALEIGNIVSLTDLNLANNRIRSLPPHIGKLINLVRIDISNNAITELPWQMSRLASLKSLALGGNRIDLDVKLDLPDVLVDEQLSALLMHLRRLPSSERPCARMKLMLVGQENVGKTSIAKCLKKEVVPVSKKLRQTIGFTKRPKDADDTMLPTAHGGGGGGNGGLCPLNTNLNLSTDGIDMDDWRPSAQDDASNAPPVTFSVWDFAGQEVYYATHTFFISSRSVFIVVFNMATFGADEASARVAYWLQCIEAWGGESQVILVGTHLDELPSGAEAAITAEIENRYFTTFPCVKAFQAVSCKSGKHISKLQNIIVRLGRAEKKLNSVYPRAFFQLESLILSERELNTPPIISREEFALMTEACGIPSAAIASAADFLKELGIIVYFDDVKSGLDQFIFIDPPWLTKLMATLITSKPNFVQAGVLEQANLHQIWKPPDFPHHLHHVLLAILQKFEIVHPLPDPKLVNNTPIPKPMISKMTQARSAFLQPVTAPIAKPASTFSSSLNKFGSISKGSSLNIVSNISNNNNSSPSNTSSNPTITVAAPVVLVPKTSAKHLIPVLLSEERPMALEKILDELNKSQSMLERIYQFEFVPIGLFAKMMIRLMHFTTVKEYWKHGVLVERDGSTSLVEATPNNLSIRLWGKNSANLLRFIVETAEVLLNGWYKLRYQFLVPCNCSTCKLLAPTHTSTTTTNNLHGGTIARSLSQGEAREPQSDISALQVTQLQAQLQSQPQPTSLSGSSSGSPGIPYSAVATAAAAAGLEEVSTSSDPLPPSAASAVPSILDDFESVSPGGTLKHKRPKKNTATTKFLTLYKTKGKPKDGKGSNSSMSFLNNASALINQSLERISSRSGDNRTMFLYEECERAIIAKRAELQCRASNAPTDEPRTVKLDALVPELLMADLGAHITIDYKELEVLEKIGEGGFGTVYKGRLRGQLVAIKQLAIDGKIQQGEEVFREFRREVWLSATLNHRSIVSLKACCLDPCCIVMEYIPNGNLYDFLRKGPYPWPLRIKIALNIASAIQYLHDFNPKICHRDLKSPNILMLSDLSDAAQVVCKVSDFGETRAVVTSALGREKLSNPIWLAPEVMRGEEYTEKADVYSFAIILWEILTGLLPFDEFPVAHSSFLYQLEDAICEEATLKAITITSYKVSHQQQHYTNDYKVPNPKVTFSSSKDQLAQYLAYWSTNKYSWQWFDSITAPTTSK
eukprot:gene6723-7816_t